MASLKQKILNVLTALTSHMHLNSSWGQITVQNSDNTVSSVQKCIWSQRHGTHQNQLKNWWKLYYINGSKQEWKYDFLKNILSFIYQWGYTVMKLQNCRKYFEYSYQWAYTGKKIWKITFKKYVFLKKRETVLNKKFIHMKKPSQRAGAYWIGFFTILSIWKKQVVIKLFIHVHFKRVEKYYCIHFQLLGKKSTKNHQPFFHIFRFHIRRTQQVSHWTITTALARINYIRRYEKNITHDDYQISTKPIQRKQLGIMKMMVSWEQNEVMRKRVYSKTSCAIFYIWSLVCYNVTFKKNSGVLCFFGGRGDILYLILTSSRIHLSKVFTL